MMLLVVSVKHVPPIAAEKNFILEKDVRNVKKYAKVRRAKVYINLSINFSNKLSKYI